MKRRVEVGFIRKLKFVSIIALMLDLFALSLYAKEALTLEQALKLAKENSVAMKTTKKNTETAKARLITAGRYANPEIGVNSNISFKAGSS